MNCASAAGAVLIGVPTDRFRLSSAILASGLGSTISACILWENATSEPVLYLFALAYGIFVGGYSATWTRCSIEVQKEVRHTELGVLNGLVGAGTGMRSVISGLVSGKLLGSRMWPQGLGAVYGTEYHLDYLYRYKSFFWRVRLDVGLQGKDLEMASTYLRILRPVADYPIVVHREIPAAKFQKAVQGYSRFL